MRGRDAMAGLLLESGASADSGLAGPSAAGAAVAHFQASDSDPILTRLTCAPLTGNQRMHVKQPNT
jgi:hypothetical protein